MFAQLSVQVSQQHMWLFSLPLCEENRSRAWGPLWEWSLHRGLWHILEMSSSAGDPHSSKGQRWLWLLACQCSASLRVCPYKGKDMRYRKAPVQQLCRVRSELGMNSVTMTATSRGDSVAHVGQRMMHFLLHLRIALSVRGKHPAVLTLSCKCLQQAGCNILYCLVT